MCEDTVAVENDIRGVGVVAGTKETTLLLLVKACVEEDARCVIAGTNETSVLPPVKVGMPELIRVVVSDDRDPAWDPEVAGVDRGEN